MAKTLTPAALEDFRVRLVSEDGPARHDALLELGEYAGTGTPIDEAKAEQIGGDYICALADGRIVAWGADTATGREIVIY